MIMSSLLSTVSFVGLGTIAIGFVFLVGGRARMISSSGESSFGEISLDAIRTTDSTISMSALSEEDDTVESGAARFVGGVPGFTGGRSVFIGELGATRGMAFAERGLEPTSRLTFTRGGLASTREELALAGGEPSSADSSSKS